MQAARGDRGLFPVHGSDGGGARDAAGGDRAHPRRHLRPLAQGQGRGLRQLPHWTLPAHQVSESPSQPQVLPRRSVTDRQTVRHFHVKSFETFSGVAADTISWKLLVWNIHMEVYICGADISFGIVCLYPAR